MFATPDLPPGPPPSLIYPEGVPALRIPLTLIRPLLTATLLCAATPAPGQVQAQQQISGKLVTATGEPVPGAEVSTPTSKTLADPSGLFQITLAPGEQTLRIVAAGHPTFLYTLTTPTPALLIITLPDPLPASGSFADQVAAQADVTVTASVHDVAEAQIKAEEHQRLIGAIPNFYVTYDHKAAPLSPAQKWELGWRTTIDPVQVAINAGVAGLQQATDAFPGYHQGAEGYFKRFGANNADTAVGTLIGGVALPIVFHQDPRYFYLGQGSIKHRTLYALSTAFRAKGDNGKWQPAYASILGDLSEGAISNLYYPATDRNGPTLTFENGLISIGSDALGNVIQEFVLRHFTPRLPPQP